MKKLFILSTLLIFICFSCNDDPEPQPEVIRAYCHLFHFISGMESIIWEVDEQEQQEESLYSKHVTGAVILESTSEEITFTVKHSETKQVLVSQSIQLEENKYYIVLVQGSEDDPSLLFREIDTSHPQAGNVKFQVLHSLPDQNGIDVYMGGNSSEKRLVTDLPYLNMSAPFEAVDYDARSAILVSAHSDEFNQDSVLLNSIYNDLIVTGASYLSVVAHPTYLPGDTAVHFIIYYLTLE